MSPFSEAYIRLNLTKDKYDKWLRSSFYSTRKDDNDWNTITGTCGSHASWVIDQLGFKSKDIWHGSIVTKRNIRNILNALDSGNLIDLTHNYNDPMIFQRLPKNNRYGNHQFQIIKGGNKYFITQGFLHGYKHSLIAYSRKEIEEILMNIIHCLTDPDNNKVWGDLDLAKFREYFRTKLFMYPNNPVFFEQKVHNIVLKFVIYK